VEQELEIGLVVLVDVIVLRVHVALHLGAQAVVARDRVHDVAVRDLHEGLGLAAARQAVELVEAADLDDRLALQVEDRLDPDDLTLEDRVRVVPRLVLVGADLQLDRVTEVRVLGVPEVRAVGQDQRAHVGLVEILLDLRALEGVELDLLSIDRCPRT